jgi:hypothetical protein
MLANYRLSVMQEVPELSDFNILSGKMIEKVLNTMSFIASWASACTEEFFINRHHSQHPNLITMVEAMIIIAAIDSLTSLWSLDVKRLRASMAT